MKISVIGSLVLLCWLAVPVGLSAQVTIPPDKDQLLKGDPAGQTAAVEKSGFPSPQKIVSLKEQLGLTKDQLRKMDEMLTNLPISAKVKGEEIIEAEEELNNYFESGSINEKTLRTKLERIGKMRADLRFIHLQVYIKEKQILSAKQWDKLKELQASEVK
jgi:Spy/CpxP family protein refolding chaperone